MKKIQIICLLFFAFATSISFSQNDSLSQQQQQAVTQVDSLFREADSLSHQKGFESIHENRFNNSERILKKKKELYLKYSKNINSIKDTLFKIERLTEFNTGVSPAVQRTISKQNDLYDLVNLKREFNEDVNPANSDFMKTKLIEVVDSRINRLCVNNYPYYTYRTSKAKYVKFVSISSGNDLFTPGGLTGAQNSRGILQRNDDRDYTGSLMIEIGTDFFRFPRRKNLKTYQTVFYGFDVYTPYFKDTTIFSKDDTFNVYDRPHASFQYFGWSKKGLSRKDYYRWSFSFKFGQIGGDNGRNFQAALHQDVSYSPRPKGWDAQISNKGRMGVSLEGTHEWSTKSFIKRKNPNSFTKIHLQALINWKVGSYMTNGSLGLQISNKNFKQCNQNFIHHRVKRNIYSWFDNLMYSISFVSTAVKHNTMLQGYGIFDPMEYRNDAMTPGSDHKLSRAQVNPVYHTAALSLSYTAPFFTIFYKWMAISPETTINDTHAHRLYYDKNKKQNILETGTMNIANRWHQFAIIGVSFNIKD